MSFSVSSLRLALASASALALSTAAAPASAQYIFWASDQGIKRANLDGTQTQFVAPGIVATALAVNPAAGKLHWFAYEYDPVHDGNFMALRRADLDGSNSERVFFFQTPMRIERMTLDVPTATIYFVEYDTQEIWRIGTDGSAIQTVINLYGGGIAGMAVDSVAGKIYINDVGKISRLNLDGSGLEDIMLSLCGPLGLSLDSASAKLYWSGCGAIRRANTDGTGAQVLLTAGIFGATNVTLDTLGQRMYWYDSARIKSANFDGTDVQTILVFTTSEGSGFTLGNVCTSPSAPDFDGDGIPDPCDPDQDNDGVLNSQDDCPSTALGSTVDAHGRPRGDANLDCVVNGDDIGPIVQVLLGGPK